MCPLGEDPGSCFFKTIGSDEAESVMGDLDAGKTGVAERLFQLEREYGPHALISSDDKSVSYSR